MFIFDKMFYGEDARAKRVRPPEQSECYKTYLHTNKETTKFPIDFVQSKREKFIEVKWCRALYNNKLVGDIMVHASFVQRDGYLDNFICFTNIGESQKYIAKYNYIGTNPTFKIWFTDMKGNEVKVDAFVLSLLLIY